MSYRSGLQMFAIMTNWKTEFHDEEMSICSSTPQAHRGYINSSLLESDLKMSESHANGLITVCGANLSLVSTILIVKWNASATACITSASAHVPCCD